VLFRRSFQEKAVEASMNTSRIGLLVAAALCTFPASALAQKAAGKGQAKAGMSVGKGEDKGAEAAAAEGEGKADAKAEAKAGAEAEGGAGEAGEQSVATMGTMAPAGGLAEICKIDPDACPKIDMEKEAAKPLGDRIYAVQQIYALRRGRFELNPYWSIALNDQFVQHPGPGLALNYYIINELAVGVNFNWYAPFNVDSKFNFNTRRAARVGVPLTEYNWGGAVNLTYVPAYGKFSGFGDFIFHWDVYLVAGGGVISTRPIAVIDPNNRFFNWKIKPAGNVGIGARIFFNRWFAAILEVRNYLFMDQLENLQIPVSAAAQADSGNWYGDDQFTIDVAAQLGVSIFLPFSFEYRLPK
jgi:outer membrane beta-barrel protein